MQIPGATYYKSKDGDEYFKFELSLPRDEYEKYKLGGGSNLPATVKTTYRDMPADIGKNDATSLRIILIYLRTNYPQVEDAKNIKKKMEPAKVKKAELVEMIQKYSKVK